MTPQATALGKAPIGATRPINQGEPRDPEQVGDDLQGHLHRDNAGPMSRFDNHWARHPRADHRPRAEPAPGHTAPVTLTALAESVHGLGEAQPGESKRRVRRPAARGRAEAGSQDLREATSLCDHANGGSKKPRASRLSGLCPGGAIAPVPGWLAGMEEPF